MLEIFADYDLIVDGTDNFATRYLVNDAAVILGKPYVWGSIYRFEGQVSVFWAQEGPQYRDLYPEPPPPGMVPSCAEGGVLGVLCASIGSIMSTEAIKLITGIGDPLIGRLMVYDALEMRYSTLKIQRDPNGVSRPPSCWPTTRRSAVRSARRPPRPPPTPPSRSRTLDGWLKERNDGGRDFVLVDVREPNEYEINKIPGSVLIPKGEFLSGDALEQLPSDKQVVLYCKTGRRSAEALAVLKGAGFADAVHVGGGVVAWVNQIDPSQPAY